MHSIVYRCSLLPKETSYDLEDRLCRRSRRSLRHGNCIRANNHSRSTRHAGVTRNYPAGNVAGATGTDPAGNPGKRSPVPSGQYIGRDLVTRGTGDGDDAALPARHGVSAMHPGKNQPVAVEHGPARQQHAADPAWRLYAEVAARGEEVPLTSSPFFCAPILPPLLHRGVRLYVRSTLSFRRSSTDQQHLEARQRGLRFKLGLAQMMREQFVLRSACRASQ